jgi:hypothetical protein
VLSFLTVYKDIVSSQSIRTSYPKHANQCGPACQGLASHTYTVSGHVWQPHYIMASSIPLVQASVSRWKIITISFVALYFPKCNKNLLSKYVIFPVVLPICKGYYPHATFSKRNVHICTCCMTLKNIYLLTTKCARVLWCVRKWQACQHKVVYENTSKSGWHGEITHDESLDCTMHIAKDKYA